MSQFANVTLTISEAAYTVEGRHLYDECEQIVNEGVESLVGQHSPGKVGDTLHLVVNEQLGRHHNETWGGIG